MRRFWRRVLAWIRGAELGRVLLELEAAQGRILAQEVEIGELREALAVLRHRQDSVERRLGWRSDGRPKLLTTTRRQ